MTQMHCATVSEKERWLWNHRGRGGVRGGRGEECGVGWIFQSSAPHYYCLQYIMYKDDGGAD